MISRSRKITRHASQKRAEAVERKDKTQSRESESQKPALGKSSSFRQKWARRWCDAGRRRKREPDAPYAIGRFDHNGQEIQEKCTDSGGY